LGNRWVGENDPTYFVADIAANHDGDLDRAKKLIGLVASAGADAAKFQNFRAPRIVSETGFAKVGQISHQAKWEKSVFEVYQAASLPWEWTASLKAECQSAGIEYFSTPYDFETVDMLDEFVSMFKIGSGDITWFEMLRKVASKHKPVLLATGASDLGEVQRAVHEITSINKQLILMQCNTNYTGSLENFDYINLNVIRTFKVMFPELVIGLSDHTPGHATVMGAVALGARVIEKHFTDDPTRRGPDHHFSMTPESWRDMVDRVRELERAFGDGEKRVAKNEMETLVVQRRCLRASRDLPSGTVLSRDMIDVLRPAPLGAIAPYEIEHVVGLKLRVSMQKGDHFSWFLLEPADP
jgi:sialic acid synthase SpsE